MYIDTRFCHFNDLAIQIHATQNHTRSIQFLGFRSGHISASRAALPDQISASSGLTKLVLLNKRQNK